MDVWIYHQLVLVDQSTENCEVETGANIENVNGMQQEQLMYW